MLHTKLTAVGDVFLGDSPHLIGHGTGSSLASVGQEAAAAAIGPLLGQADVHFVNLETVVSHAGRRAWSLSSVEMRGRPGGARFLGDCGWTVANIANNHIFQHGAAAFDDTVERLAAAGLAVVGGLDADRRAHVSRIASPVGELSFVGFSLRPEQYAVGCPVPYSIPEDDEEVVRRSAEAVEQAGGPVIVSLHWGEEFMTEPSRQQQALARRLCEAGVRLVIGHHPHVIQGVERVGDSVVAYSLGNFLFDLLDEQSRKSAVLDVTLNGDGSTEYELRPVALGDDFLPRLPEPREAEALAAEYAELTARLESGPLPDQEDLVRRARAYYGEFSRRNYRHFFGSLHRYNPLYSGQSIARGVLRRLGVVHDP